MPVKKWTEEKLNEIKEKKKTMSATQIAKEYTTTKNSILGVIYRDKIKNGYVPSSDSKYTGRKNL
jgi:hypothetical protein|tara:strand:- start:536 stop:730 length:195 start_codon:yes stop_codon:yes gene_type:complete